LLGRLESRQPLGELAIRHAGPRDDGGGGQRLEKMTRDVSVNATRGELNGV
jgi:hypothetical protein